MIVRAAAWLAFMIGLLAGGEIQDAGSFTLGAAGGAALVWAGYAAAWRVRELPARSNAQRARLALLTLAAGIGLGLVNLGANWLIAESDPALRALLVRRFATLRPIEGIVAAPLTEEISMRLFLMSVLAWVILRATERGRLAFGFALAASSLFFAVLHLARPLPLDPELANFYRVTLVVKYTFAGATLAWIYWRWGLPYSIVCHALVNGTHVVVQRFVFF